MKKENNQVNNSSSEDENENFQVRVYDGAPTGKPGSVREVFSGVWWVGEDNEDPFHCNPFLVKSEKGVLLIDPGGLLYAEALLEKVAALVNLKDIHYIIAHHQDPDVCSGLNALRPLVAQDCRVVCHSRMSVLIKHFGAGFDFYEVDREGMKLNYLGREFRFAHTPYLHSPGAIVTYDPNHRLVFSSDLFGGITEDWDLKAGKNYNKSMHAFHVGYMPSTDILANGLKQIQKLGPIDAILPQHGSIIEGPMVQKVLSYLEELPVGAYADDQFQEMIKKQQDMKILRQMVEGANLNIMFADPDGVIKYMNRAALDTFRTMEKFIPVPVDEMVGSNVDLFHANPQHQKTLFKKHKTSLPRRTNFTIGNEHVSLNANPIYGDDGDFLGVMATWEVVTEDVKRRERDERIRGEIIQTTGKLLENAGGMGAISADMSSIAEETSNQANTVSTSTSRLTENINEVRQAIAEMTKSITEISQNAARASSSSSSAVDSVRHTNETIQKLGQSSEEIDQVIKVIQNIAMQTNILALNATIEAARAGEAGKGFAVVANEVKELAKETKNSTEEITIKVTAIQKLTASAVEEIAKIRIDMERINEVSATIASAVEEQSAVSSEISNNMTRAAAGVDEISTNISGVAQAAQETSKGAGKALKASQELEDLARSMQAIVDSLK